MIKIYGQTGGLKANQLRRLNNLYRRRTAPAFVVSPELSKAISQLSFEIRRQIGLLIDRQGWITHVMVGNHQAIVIPNLEKYRSGGGRLKGLRCVHTHLQHEPLTQDDLMDLALLKLDLMAAITIDKEGRPDYIHAAHLLTEGINGQNWQMLPPLPPWDPDIDCQALIRSLESEFARKAQSQKVKRKWERALLVSVTTAPRRVAEDSMIELRELAESSNIAVADTVIQHRQKIGPRFLMGEGKLSQLVILALQKGADLLIFDQELNPSQVRSITDLTDMRVIDRTQLILDIFAQRARSREGKIQVELAQLKYLLPRLVGKGTAMSRLTGGIGGRGPGETKLEVDRRRVRDRIGHLEKLLREIQKQRGQRRARRNKRGLPVISIIGYTNAGKSTLLNTLTKSSVLAESRLFATLDPTSKRKKFPKDVEVIITDTVGFIRQLPEELITAFRATLEELEDANLLLHVIDISNPRFADQIKSVERILESLHLDRIPVLRVLNKQDRVGPVTVKKLTRTLDAVAISANDEQTLTPLLDQMELHIRRIIKRSTCAARVEPLVAVS
ncbi:MAG: GTPase HflX [Deltaproteobacteria bacterium]|nr:GTPase HflX [Deltaproteobacteria bacterium]MBW1793955.1 GTPase HflX [Deltaproteobacteria bacterium]MBW2329729.1 GTPase HflX [Deltaproteobacteria bacterium]